MEETGGEQVGVTLFPADYEPVAMVTEQGDEMLHEEFTDAQLFVHAIQELERVRSERSKKKKKEDKAPKKAKDGDVKLEADAMDDDDVVMKEEEESKTDGEAASDEQEQDEDEEEDEVIDPRIYYRPMVAELQAAVVELHQLINSIDLIRRRDFLEEMRCIRENTALKKEDLEYLVESKATQIKEANRILLDGVEALASTVEKETVFFQGVTQMLRKWKLIAPIHGNIPKPFRAGEPLAVDCSYVSAGSTFAPMTRSIADVAFAELCRTEKGLVRVKTPDDFMLRTIQLKLESMEAGKAGTYTLPLPDIISMPKAEMDRLTNTPDDRSKLEARNVSVLKAVQFSVFSEEIFYSAMREALQPASNWTDMAYSAGNYASSLNQFGGHSKPSISVLQVLDDELQFRVNEKYKLTLRLMDAKSIPDEKSDELDAAVAADVEVINDAAVQNGGAANGELEPIIGVKVEGMDVTSSTNGAASHSPSLAPSRSRRLERRVDPVESDEAFLAETCRYSASLLQQEMRQYHGRKEIARALMYNGDSMTHPSAVGGSLSMASSGSMGSSQLGDSSDAHRGDYTNGNAIGGSSSSSSGSTSSSGGVLSTVLEVLAHNLLKHEVTEYLDELSRVLAFQKMQVSSSGRVLDDGLMQPICDSVRGVYVGVRWKTCAYDSTLAAFDLSIGKNFVTEVLIAGTRIHLQSATTASSAAAAAAHQEVAGLVGLRTFVESAVCAQVASSLHRDALSLGVKQAAMDLDRASVRVFSAGEWDGSCIGDGRVSDSRAVGSICFEPFVAADKSLAINCTVQAIDVSASLGSVLASPPASEALASSLKRGGKCKVDWVRIPGASDIGKFAWLLQRTGILPPSLAVTAGVTSALANGAANGVAAHS